jgi:hypothetical protein
MSGVRFGHLVPLRDQTPRQIPPTRNHGRQKREQILAVFRTSTYPPSIRELCEAVGLSSSSTVWSHLEQLIAEGWLTRRKANCPRGIVLADPPVDRVREALELARALDHPHGPRIVELLEAELAWRSRP